jgi:glycine/D-amino acid oxidase-like deaminating enzyme
MRSVDNGSTAIRRGDEPVIVIGGGAVGLCVAHYLAAAGVPVEVVEQETLGSGASWGNAGWVCRSHSAPVPGPGVIRYALRSLGRPDSPLYLRPSPDLAFLRWAWRFWRSSNSTQFQAGYAALAELNRPTFELFHELAERGVDTTLRQPGIVHAFLSVEEARRHLAVQRAMAGSGYEVPDDVSVGAAAQALDGALSPDVAAAYLIPDEGVVDPDRFVQSLATFLVESGGVVHERLSITGFEGSNGSVTAVRTNHGDRRCSAVVIAAGVWSAALAGELGYRLPLRSGKGYSFSVELDPAPRRPLYLGDKRIVATPMKGAVRIAGTRELSGNKGHLDWRRIVAIANGSRHYLGRWYDDPNELPDLIRDAWVGGRPLLADGLPVLDRVADCSNAFVATGHGMLGITLAPASGKALADYLLSGRRPEVLEPFRFDRFGGRATSRRRGVAAVARLGDS